MRNQPCLADNPENAIAIHFFAGRVIESIKATTLKVNFAIDIGNSENKTRHALCNPNGFLGRRRMLASESKLRAPQSEDDHIRCNYLMPLCPE